MPSSGVARPKGDLISKKRGRRSTSLSQSHRQPLFFEAKYPYCHLKYLDTQILFA